MSWTPPTPPQVADVPLLAGKVVVISGIGPGLGRALGEQAARMGADVVVAARTQDRLDKMADQIRALGQKALPVVADVTDEAACQRLVAAALAEFGKVDALINNAFAIPPMEPLTTIEAERLQQALEVNAIAPIRLARLFADALAATNGAIVNINSAVLRQSQVEFAGYKFTKAALLHASSSLATELGPRGIRVNSVAPSWIYEGINQAYFDWLAQERGVTHQDIYTENAAPTDLKRLATPEEVARATLFLASDLASAITGACLDISCGEFHQY